jgi:hypothetical protein
MATKTPETDPPEPDEPKLKAGEFRALIRETVTSLLPDLMPKGGTPDPKTPAGADPVPAGDVQSQVQAALKTLQDKEASDNRAKQIDDTLKGLVEKTAEAPPVERRRVHRLMGWGE